MAKIQATQIEETMKALDNQTVTVNGDVFTVGQLRGTFEEVMPGAGWKKAINFVLNGDIEAINRYNAAIVFHVGGHNKIEVLGHSANNLSLTVRITNPGYYVNIGA